MKFRCMIDIDKKIELTKVKATKSKVKVKFIVMGKHVSLLNMSWNVYPIFMPFIHRDPRYRVSWVIKLFFEICWHYWQPVPRVKWLVYYNNGMNVLCVMCLSLPNSGRIAKRYRGCEFKSAKPRLFAGRRGCKRLRSCAGEDERLSVYFVVALT